MGTKVVQANKETLGTKAVLVGTKAVLAIKETLETKVALAHKETLETKADLAINETLGTKALLVKKANKGGAASGYLNSASTKTKVNKLFAEGFELNRRGSGNNELLGQKRLCENKKTSGKQAVLATMKCWFDEDKGQQIICRGL